MNDRVKRLLAVALLVSAVLSPFVFFSTPLKTWQSPNPLATVFQNGLYPIERLWHGLTSGLGHAWTTYVAVSGAADENQKLRGQLAGMQTRIMDYEEQVLENDRLRKLLGFSGRSEKKLIAAEVVGHNDASRFESIRITRGLADGVRVGMPVVAADGVVGKVIRSGGHFADVQLLVDSDFYIDVLLQRTRVRGVLSGAAHTQCNLQLHKRVEIRIGDTVITSGIVGGFPKGLPVGRVMRITYESENVAQAITVEPWVDHRRPRRDRRDRRPRMDRECRAAHVRLGRLMEMTLGRLRTAATQLRPFMAFHPHTGRAWLDCVLLLVVGALHHTVLPSLTGGIVPIDLMTPWLVTTLVLAPLPRGALVTLIGALIVETHTAAPAGLYIVAYWAIAAVLYLTRSTLSWRHAFPWLVTFAMAELWVIGFETFVMTVNAGSFPLEPRYFASQAARLLLAVGIGMALCRRFLATGLAGGDAVA